MLGEERIRPAWTRGHVTRGGPSTGDGMGINLPEVNVGTSMTVQQTSLGGMHACVVLDDGGLKCWGRNDKGQLGLGDTVGHPEPGR